MKKVVYYTSTYFFELSLEIINMLKEEVDLHVLIEVTPTSKNANIVNIENLPQDKYLAAPEELFSEKDFEYFKPYFKGAASVQFVVHNHPTGVSISTLKASRTVKKLIKQINPEIIHFEGFSLRTLGLATFFTKVKKIILAIHDGALHAGEESWKTSFPRFIFFKFPVKKIFLFYSEFTYLQFKTTRKLKNINHAVLKMSPFSYFNKLGKSNNSGNGHLLFFGRISKYKGVDILLDAMPSVFEKFAGEKLIIAGKGGDEELLNHSVLKEFSNNITFLNRYIPNDELVGLIKGAKIIICPYRDASQSGVLMTAFALNKPVIAADTGAFSEDVVSGYNGMLIKDLNAAKLAGAMNDALDKKSYIEWEKNLENSNKENPWVQNMPKIKELYA